MLDALNEAFADSFVRLENEIAAYSITDTLYLKEGDVNNSAGNLCAHICGNLQHFIGEVLGESGYQRQREIEFSGRFTKDELISEIKTTRKVVLDTLSNLSDEKLNSTFPIEVFKRPMSTRYFLIHLHGHLNYHLGQISYHRRLLDKSSKD